MYRNDKRRNIVIGTVIATVLIIVAIAVANGANFQRGWKSLQSNYGGGLNRTITVYDYNGNPIKSWSGKFDVQESESRVFFDDENGKRVIIYNGIVINEEN
jgi:hypothetical protein